MSDLLIRGVDTQAIQRLKVRAKRNGRSLQGEAKLILEQAAGHSMPEALAAAGEWRKKLGRKGPAKRGKRFEDSTILLREDRER
jgi:plasmid stability protein